MKGYRPAEQEQWAYATGGTNTEKILCHGDFGPWNIVWQGEEPVGILDWDMATPALPESDILYALEYSAPFRDDQTTLKWHHFPELPNRKHRIEVFTRAYGIKDWVANGALEQAEKQARWTESHTHLFE